MIRYSKVEKLAFFCIFLFPVIWLCIIFGLIFWLVSIWPDIHDWIKSLNIYR